MQYTLRNVLARSLGQPVRVRNLRGMPGVWTKKDAANLDACTEHRRIDEDLWK